jgi:hypothetical protein
MTDILVAALTFLIAIAAAHAGSHFTKLVQDKWSKRNQ